MTIPMATTELATSSGVPLYRWAFRLPVGRPVTQKVYRDAAHPSRLVLPFTAQS
jgi:hypothetical protein